VLVFDRHEWLCFLDGARAGEFDDAAQPGPHDPIAPNPGLRVHACLPLCTAPDQDFDFAPLPTILCPDMSDMRGRGRCKECRERCKEAENGRGRRKVAGAGAKCVRPTAQDHARPSTRVAHANGVTRAASGICDNGRPRFVDQESCYVIRNLDSVTRQFTLACQQMPHFSLSEGEPG
jgi:hypothetical protein